MDKGKIAAVVGAAGAGAALLVHQYLKWDEGKWEQAQEEIDLLQSMGLPSGEDGGQSQEELDLLRSMGQPPALRGKPLVLSTAKERQFQFQRLETGAACCRLCGRAGQRRDLAPARYAFAPLGPQADSHSLPGLAHLPSADDEDDEEGRERRERTRCRMLAGLPLEWETREKAKLLSFRTGAAGLPAPIRGQFLQGFGLDDGSPICPDCAQKLQSTLAERRQGWERVETYPYTFRGKIPCDPASAVLAVTHRHPLKQEALQELKEYAAICGIDYVYAVEYRYEKSGASDWKKAWIGAGKMAKKREEAGEA